MTPSMLCDVCELEGTMDSLSFTLSIIRLFAAVCGFLCSILAHNLIANLPHFLVRGRAQPRAAKKAANLKLACVGFSIVRARHPDAGVFWRNAVAHFLHA